MVASLEGIRVKFDWANKHAQEFKSALRIAIDNQSNSIKTNVKTEINIPKPHNVTDTRRWDLVTLYVAQISPFPSEIGLRLGEVIHHFRGGLDHLVWKLVPSATRRRIKASGRQNIQFPLARSYRNFCGNIKRSLPDVAQSQIDIIERYQPYHRSITGRAMRLLRNLSNIDKHRIIVLPVFLPSHADLDFTLQGADIIRGEHLFDRMTQLKEGTEVARMVVAIKNSQQFKVDIKGRFDNSVILPKSLFPPFFGTTYITVTDAVEEISNQCLNLLREISDSS